MYNVLIDDMDITLFHIVLATSGIDYDVKLWEPTADVPCCLDNREDVVKRNETMLRENRNTITVPSMFVFRILSYLNRRRRSKLPYSG